MSRQENQANELRKWLKRHPQPSQIRAYTSDDDERLVNVGTTKSRWRDAENACDPYPKLEALDAKGSILRTFVRDDGETTTEKAKAFDPESARLQHFSTLLAEAYGSVNRAFEMQSQLMQELAKRNAALEHAWQKMLNQLAAFQAQPEENTDVAGEILKVVAPMLLASQTAVVATPNGKKANG